MLRQPQNSRTVATLALHFVNARPHRFVVIRHCTLRDNHFHPNLVFAAFQIDFARFPRRLRPKTFLARRKHRFLQLQDRVCRQPCRISHQAHCTARRGRQPVVRVHLHMNMSWEISHGVSRSPARRRTPRGSRGSSTDHLGTAAHSTALCRWCSTSRMCTAARFYRTACRQPARQVWTFALWSKTLPDQPSPSKPCASCYFPVLTGAFAAVFAVKIFCCVHVIPGYRLGIRNPRYASCPWMFICQTSCGLASPVIS